MKRRAKRKPIFAIDELIQQQRDIRALQAKLELDMEILYGQGELIHDLLAELKARMEDRSTL